MVRVVAVMASLLLMVGGLLLQRSAMLPSPGPLPAPAAAVERGVPLTPIDLCAPAQRLDRVEAVAGAHWWDHQDQARLDRLTGLLRADSPIDGWTGLYACAGSQGDHVLLVVGHRGRLGTATFAADGTLLACDDTPDETLPMVLPQAGGRSRPLAPTVARELLLRLRYLRERSPIAWYDGDSGERSRLAAAGGSVDDASDVRCTLVVEDSDHALFSHRVSGPCFVRGKPGETPPAADPEPPLPVADN